MLRRAPTLITGVNLNHRLARGLRAAFTFETGRPYEWIRHGFGITNGSTAPTPVAEAAGKGIHYTSNQQAHRFDTGDINLGPPQYTHVFVFSATSFNTWGAAFSNSDGDTAAGTTNFSKYSGGPNMAVWHDTTPFTFGDVADWTDGNVHVGAISSGVSANSIRVHRDGILYASGSLKAAGTFTNCTFNFAQDRFHTGADFTGDYYLHLIYDRQLPDSAIKQISADPWVIFRPSEYELAAIAAATTQTITTSLDTAIAKAQSNTASLDLAIAKAQSVTADLDAVIAAGQVVNADLDAAVQALKTITASLDLSILSSATVFASLDAALLVANSLTSTIDMAVQASKETTVSIDMFITSGSSVSVSFDLAVQALITATASLDLAIAKAQSETVSIDLVRAKTMTAQTTVNAALSKLQTLSASLDMSIEAGSTTNTVTLSIDAALAATISASASLDMAIQKTAFVSASMDVARAFALSVSTDLDAYIAETRTVSTSIEALVRGTVTSTALIDLYISSGVLSPSSARTFKAYGGRAGTAIGGRGYRVPPGGRLGH